MVVKSQKTKHYCLYLAKPEVTKLEDVLTDSAKLLVQKNGATKLPNKSYAEGAILYTFSGKKSIPKWVSILKPTFPVPDDIRSISPCALLVFKQEGRIFILTFSFSHVYIDDLKIEADFGLKVAINSVSDQKVKSVERANIGFAIRDLAQSAKLDDLGAFGLDDALDLIRKVSGHTSSDFSANLTGAKSLRFSSKIELDELPSIATKTLKLYSSKAYKKTAFKVIDFLAPVVDMAVVKQLDDELIKSIISGSDEFEIAIPQMISDKVASYKFERTGYSNYLPDLSLELYRKALGDNLNQLTQARLKEHAIGAYDDTESHSLDYWSIYHSLVGSVVFDSKRYALNEGGWYHVSKRVREAADTNFDALHSPSDKKLLPFKKLERKHKKKKKKSLTSYQSEESYNEEMAAHTGYLLMDRKLVSTPEKPGRGIEVCDLLDIEGRRFIHVKKSSRQSSVLSHFFKQGHNSARMLKTDEEFKAGVIATLKKHFGDVTAQEFDDSLKKNKWCVEYQIADFPRKDGKHNIPFFSKLTLKEEARAIKSMGFDIKLCFIKLQRIEDTVTIQSSGDEED